MSQSDMSPNEYVPGADETYDMNLALAESLEELEAKNKKYKKRQRFWHNNGWLIAFAPIIATGAVMATPLRHEMNSREKIASDAYSVAATVFMGLVAINGYEKNREKSQEVVVSAAPISLALNNSLQPWIVRGLSEMHAKNSPMQ